MTSAIREWYHLRFVRKPKTLGKLLGFGQHAGEIISKFHDYTFWLPINIMGDELRSQSWIVDMFLLVLSYRSRTPLSQKFRA